MLCFLGLIKILLWMFSLNRLSAPHRLFRTAHPVAPEAINRMLSCFPWGGILLQKCQRLWNNVHTLSLRHTFLFKLDLFSSLNSIHSGVLFVYDALSSWDNVIVSVAWFKKHWLNLDKNISTLCTMFSVMGYWSGKLQVSASWFLNQSETNGSLKRG